MNDFLADLKARGSADLNAVMSTLNEGGLCRETLERWKQNGWVDVAPAMPLVALRGARFSRDLTLSEFCGGPRPEEPAEAGAAEAGQTEREERTDHDHS